MAIDSDYVQSMATQLAQSSVQSQLNKLNRNDQTYQAQQTALNSLDSALKTFKSAASALKTGNSKMLVNNAKFSQEGFATATVKSDAVDGSYDFYVKQLASKSQVALTGLSDSNLGGSLKISLGEAADNAFEVDLSGASSLADVAAAINNAADNKGVKATLVRSNDQVNLVLTSEKTGADQAISLSALGNQALTDAVANRQELSKAQDAEVYLGGSNGLRLNSSSNTFENMIDGVSLTFNKVHSNTTDVLTVDVARDQSASQANVKKFVDAFNTLMSSFDSLTASGGESGTRGALAGDSSIRSIESMLNQVVRTSFAGVSLIDFGVSADRNGKLSIDSARFEKALAANPDGLDQLFTEKDGLLDSIDKNLAVYTASAGGVMANRKESLSLSMARVNEQFDNLQKQYDASYNRYLRQYTNLMQTMTSMEQTSGLFV